jgi:hypothetical protein
MADMDETARELMALQQRYATLAIENWVTHSVFTWGWWFLVIFMVVNKRLKYIVFKIM